MLHRSRGPPSCSYGWTFFSTVPTGQHRAAPARVACEIVMSRARSMSSYRRVALQVAGRMGLGLGTPNAKTILWLGCERSAVSTRPPRSEVGRKRPATASRGQAGQVCTNTNEEYLQVWNPSPAISYGDEARGLRAGVSSHAAIGVCGLHTVHGRSRLVSAVVVGELTAPMMRTRCGWTVLHAFCRSQGTLSSRCSVGQLGSCWVVVAGSFSNVHR